MKLKSIKAVMVTEGADDMYVLEPSFDSVDLCVDATGKKAMSLVDIDVGAQTAPTVPITVESDSSASTKGRRRMMIKVTFPYSPVVVDENGTLVVDRTRAGGEVEAHLVISVPRALEQDARASDSAVGRKAALCQIALVQQLLSTIVGFGPHTQVDTTSGALNATVQLPLASLDGTKQIAGGVYELGSVRSANGLAIPSVAYRLHTAAGFGNARLDPVDGIDAIVANLALPTNAWMRGLSGLPPLACGEEITLNGASA